MGHERGRSRLKGRNGGHFALIGSGAMPIPSAAMPPETPPPPAVGAEAQQKLVGLTNPVTEQQFQSAKFNFKIFF